MEKNGVASKILLVFLILFFCLLCLSLVILNILKKEDELEEYNNSVSIEDVENEVNNKKIETIEDIIRKYDSEYISSDFENVYVVLSKDLFSENGNSNERFINSLVSDLIVFFKPNNFYIIDEEKDIEIFVEYNPETEEYEIIINDVEEFYSKVDGEAYIAVDTSEITKGNNFAVNNYILDTLEINNFYFSSIKDIVGEGKDLENGYTSYLDGSVKIRTVATGGVKNIIFTDDYEENLTYRLNTSMSLKEVLETEPKHDFGSVEKGYLGYRQLQFYLFFYDDEVSVYTYSYQENKVFESLLKDYLETKNLKNFVNMLSKKWMAYDYLEYDEETDTAHILYSTRGVDINIINNDSTGITFYNNYYFTDYTKSLVKTGKVKFEPNTDLVEKTEIKRRNSN